MKLDTELINKVFNTTVVDFTKPGFNKRERAVIIERYMKMENISIRQMARRLNISHSALRKWLGYIEVSKQGYNKLKESGLTDNDIVELHRSGKRGQKDIIKFKINEANRYLMFVYRELDDKTSSVDILNELKNTGDIINRCVLRIEGYIKAK